MATIRTTIYLSEIDRHALAQLQAHYGLSTLSDAIRLAVRTCARSLGAPDDASAIRQEVAATTQAELTQSRSELVAMQAEAAATQAELAGLHGDLQQTNAESQAHVEPEGRLSLPAEAPMQEGTLGAPPVTFTPSSRGEQVWAVLQQTRAQVSYVLERARTVLEQQQALRQAREAARHADTHAVTPAAPI